ncbi:MAG: protein of unknown function ElaB [Verrucomicrobia bacterium]|nr:protein of unknown function ElaB [Verrucomicrobiota bacterium]
MLAGPVSDHAVSQLTDLKFRLSEAKDKIVELYSTAQRKVIDGARAVDDTIRRRPYESLVVALGVGVICGKILAGRRVRED